MVVGAPEGRWFAPLRRPILAIVMSKFVSQRMLPFLARINQDDLVVLKELIEAGVVTPVIDRTYPLSQTAEAVRYQEGGHALGKVVITVRGFRWARPRAGPPPRHPRAPYRAGSRSYSFFAQR